MSLATFALYRARLTHRFELSLEPRNSFLHTPAINFQLRFPRATRADATRLAGQVMPHPGETRQKILQLGELDLQSTLTAPRALRKNVENQLSSIEDLSREQIF